MRKLVRFALPVVLAGMAAVLGCGGGSGPVISATKSASLKGTATVPVGTPSRFTGRDAGSNPLQTDIPLPGATVKVFDVTVGGIAALSGAPVKTTMTLADGSWAVTGLTPGDNYVVTISKTVIGGTGGTGGATLALQAYVHTPAATSVPTASNVTVDLSSTLAAAIVVQVLTSQPGAASTDLTTIYVSYVATVTMERQDGTLSSVDLTNPQSYTIIASQAAGNSLKDATYIDDGTNNSRHDLVNLMVSKTKGKVAAVLLVEDATGNIFDADYYAGTLNSDGTFAGTTKDGLYTITGSVNSTIAYGAWASVDQTMKGVWEAGVAAGHTAGTPTYTGVGYYGQFTKGTSTSPEGVWAFFVNATGKAVMFVHDEARLNITHLERTAVVMGSVNSSGNVTGNMVFPVVPTNGAISGIDPAEGGTATGTGSASLSSGYNHTVSGTVDVTGSITNDSVTGTWSFSGLRNGANYMRSGAWNGTTF